MDHAAELDVRDVDLDLVGHVLGQALDLQLTQVVLDDAALLDADSLARLDHRHAHGDRLGAADRQEVDVHELGVDVIALDLTRDGEVLLALDHDVDQHVGAGTGVEQVLQLAGIDRQREWLRCPGRRARRVPSRRRAACGRHLCRHRNVVRR